MSGIVLQRGVCSTFCSPGTLVWALLSALLENVLKAIMRVHPQDPREYQRSGAQHLLMPVGKPAETCREAFDRPQASHAAETPIWNYPAWGSNSLETLDRDCGQSATYCSHSVHIQDADDCIAVRHQCAHLRTCFEVLLVSVSAVTMSASDTWQQCLIWISLSLQRQISASVQQ